MQSKAIQNEQTMNSAVMNDMIFKILCQQQRILKKSTNALHIRQGISAGVAGPRVKAAKVKSAISMLFVL